MKIFLYIISLFFIPAVLFADINMAGVRAYPVPFNPNVVPNMTIDYPGVTLTGTAKINIYDVNGDLMLSTSSSNPLGYTWNGRNANGRLVAPGMYIIKVEILNNDGSFGKKLIRILINY